MTSGRSLLLYARSETLLPVIEEIVRELRVLGRGELLFDRVVSANRYASDDESRAYLRWLLDRYDTRSEADQLYEASPLEVALRDSIRTMFGLVDSYLGINSIPIQDVTEFQFTFYETLPERGPRNLPITDVQPTKYVSVPVDIRGDFRRQLSNGLRRAIPASNHPPVPRVPQPNNTLFGLPGMEYPAYVVPAGEAVVLDASGSEDPDTPSGEITYHWVQRELDSETISYSRVFFGGPRGPYPVRFEPGEPTLHLSPLRSGWYSFSLTVDDHVSTPASQRVDLVVTDAMRDVRIARPPADPVDRSESTRRKPTIDIGLRLGFTPLVAAFYREGSWRQTAYHLKPLFRLALRDSYRFELEFPRAEFVFNRTTSFVSHTHTHVNYKHWRLRGSRAMGRPNNPLAKLLVNGGVRTVTMGSVSVSDRRLYLGPELGLSYGANSWSLELTTLYFRKAVRPDMGVAVWISR